MRFKEVKDPVHKDVKTILPERQTTGSAGYDFYTKENLIIRPGETVPTFTDTKCELGASEVLNVYIRSSIGIKKKLMLANGTGIIDSDYFENEDNDGNIGIVLHNYGKEELYIPKGTRVAQGVIFRHYGTDGARRVRSGGFGSTGERND